MNLNCVAGDIAFLVNMPGPRTWHLIGRVVRVTRLVFEEGEPCWEYEGPPLIETEHEILGLIEDEFLRPIRPDGVTDEEVRDLYAPTMPEQWERAYEEAYGGSRG